MNWFLANGDKLLNSIGVLLGALSAGHVIPTGGVWGAVIAGVLSILHQFVLPEPTPTPTPAK